MTQNKKNESGRTLLETIAVLVVAAILLLAGVVGYNVVIHQWRKHQTVKQITELAVRYKLRPVAKEGYVDIKTIYPEAERASAIDMKTADTDAGRVSLLVQDTTAFSVIVNNILDDSCEAQLENGDWESVLAKPGSEDFNDKGEYVVIGRDLFKNWEKVSEDKKPEKLKDKTKEQLISYLCQGGESGQIQNMSLVWGDKCSRQGYSYWYSGKCWTCPSGKQEDEYGQCCKKEEMNACGVCNCPAARPVCDDKGENPTYQCVECIKDEDCDGHFVCSDEHKCVPCKPYTQEGCAHNEFKKWCSPWFKCEECLDNYKADATEGYRCGSDKPKCDNDPSKLENWKCEEWPCALKPLSEECIAERKSGSLIKGDKCAAGVCECGVGLECKEPVEGATETCSTCQCKDEAPADLMAPAEGRQKGQACDGKAGNCPCGKNENGVQLVCVDNMCSCLENDEACGSDSDCCVGSCNEGKCGPKVCKKTENDTGCVSDATDYTNCCAEGTTCQSIRGNQVCCTGNGQEGASCTHDNCCGDGLSCDAITHKCRGECSDGGSCDVKSCCDDQNCITRSDTGDKTCCPAEETGDVGDPCTNDSCCQSGSCHKESEDDEKGVCVENCLPPRSWVMVGETKTCCDNSGENGTVCASDACCTSGNCVKDDDSAETGICCQKENADVGEACSNNVCCASGSCKSNTCCPTTLPTEGETCSVACGCAEGYNCNTETLTCVPPTCSNTDEERQQEGADCSEYCPCGVNPAGEQMTCASDNKCHACTSGYWRQAEGKDGACCPVETGLDLGSVCTSDSCCKSGNCSIAEGESEGHCCQSTYTWIQSLKDSSSGQCCASVVSEGQNCSGQKDGCCQGGYCRQVYTKMKAKTTQSTSYPCLKTKEHKEKCETCHCGKCSKSTCYWYECKKYDYNSPQVTTKTSAYANKGLTGPYRCCEGEGDLGSPCSEECPCQGTAFQYYTDGKLTKTEIKTTEYKSIECSCTKVPLLYCRQGTCQLNPYVPSTGEKTYKATAMNCAYKHDFSNTKDGKCYLCPADSSFRADSTYVGCCPPGSLTVTDQCARYKKSEGYASSYEEGELFEGFYLDERTGEMTLCSKGSYCVGGKKYPCDEGTYSDTQGATSCHYCGAGYYCPAGATEKTKCPAGFYCPEWGTTRTQMNDEYFCAPGTYSAAGSSAVSACKTCPKNYYCPGKGDKIACDGKNLPGSCPETGMTAPIEGTPGQYLNSSKKLVACEKGYYCPDGLRRYDCEPGTYADETGLSACKQAPAGVAISAKRSTGAKDTTSGHWVVCAAGTYAAGTGNIECASCASGTYQNEKGQAECKACPDGTTSAVKSTAASACKACAEGSVAQVSADQTQCCSSTQKVVANEATGWKTCCANSKDRYCKNKSGTYACRLTADCALSEEEAAATACSAKQYISSGKCADCTAGYSCNGSVREKCPAGTYAAKGDGVCTKCPAGSYQDKVGQDSCTKASSNKYTDTTGATTYQLCVGNTIPNDAHTACVACATGTKVNSSNTKCSAVCSAGEMYVDGTCRRCQQNFYCPNGYQEIACPQYQFSLPGAKKCSSCEDGKYWNSNSGKCVTCEAGYKCASGIREKCPDGSTSVAGMTSCVTCAAGQYFNTSKKSCQPCDAGKYSAGGTVTTCTACPKGQYQSAKGQSSCLPCPEGTYKSSTGGTSCTKCGAGKWYAGTGATASGQCTSCPAGSYCTSGGVKTTCPAGSKCSAGASSATQCSAGTYQNAVGQSSCATCPTGQISAKGATQCTSCTESKGANYYTSDHTSCPKCTGTIYSTKDKNANADGKQICCSSSAPKYCKNSTSATATYGCRKESACKVY